MAIKDLYPSIRPTLDLNFAGTRTVDPRITFSRASTATYFDEFGVMRTAPVNTPRIDFDPATGECKGLLIEEQRTNLLLNSATLATQNITVTAVAHTLTFYGTGTVTLSGAATEVLVGTGAVKRVALTFTPTAGTLTLTVTGSCTQGQLEVGAFPTSHIPTTSAQATRAADSALMTGSNFSSWYQQDEGTLFAEFAYLTATPKDFSNIYELSNGTADNRIFSRKPNFTGIDSQIVNAGTLQVNFLTEFLQAGKNILAYKTNDIAYVQNAGIASTDTSAVIPTMTQLSIGWNGRTGNYMIGHIRKIAYYPKRISNINLQALTT